LFDNENFHSIYDLIPLFIEKKTYFRVLLGI